MSADEALHADLDLLERIAMRDASAVGQLYDRHARTLYSLVHHILRDSTEAEDVLQEVFLQVWRRARDFDESRGRAFTWLVTIARSRALDRLRAGSSRARLATEAEAEPRDSMGDAAADAVRSEEGEIVRRALSELPAEQRRTLFMAYFEGLTQTEIAARLGDPLGTVKTRMRTGLMKLRELLRDQSRS